MWQRFTERTKRCISFAQEEAARLGENYVGTEHLLLGLLREKDTAAAHVLERLGVNVKRVRQEVERLVSRGDGRLGQEMQLTPRAKRVFDLAYHESRQLNNNHIGTEHLLLGLIRESDGIAGRVLARLGAELENARQAIRAMQEKEGKNKSSRWRRSGVPTLDDVNRDDSVHNPAEDASEPINRQDFKALKLLTPDGPVSLPLNAIREITIKTATGEFTGRFLNITTEQMPPASSAPPADGVQDEPPSPPA